MSVNDGRKYILLLPTWGLQASQTHLDPLRNDGKANLETISRGNTRKLLGVVGMDSLGVFLAHADKLLPRNNQSEMKGEK